MTATATVTMARRSTFRARQAVLDAAVVGPLRQAPGRTLLAVLAIALGVALGFSVYLINRVAADEVQGASRSLFGLADLAVRAPGAGFDEALFPRVAQVPGVAVASPIVELQVRLPGRERNLQLIGIDPFRAFRLQPALAEAGRGARREGQGLLAPNSLWLSPAAAQALDLEVGEDLDVQVALDRVTFEVAGILPPGAYRQPVGLLDIGEAQWRLRRLGRLDRIDLRLEPRADRAAVRAAIEELLPPGVQVVTPGEATDDAVRLTRAYRSNLTALALVALFTGAFLVFATQSLAVARRRREIALLHAMGMTVREQLGASLLAGTIVGVLGAALGVVLGALVARAGLAAFGADLGAGYFRGPASSQLDIGASEYLVFFLLGVAAALVATYGPAREAASVPAAAALKAGDEAPIAARRHGWTAAGFFVAGMVALALPPLEGVALPGYVSIACLLLGAVLLTPSLAAWIFTRVLRPEGAAWRQIAVAQLRGTARRATVSIAAVLVSFSLMVAMAIMVFSFRMSLEAWMERILPADLYVRAGSAAPGAYLDPAAQSTIETLGGVARVHFVRFVDVVLPGHRLPLTIIARPIEETTAERILPIRRSDPRPPPADTLPVWASEAALDLRGFDVGQVIELPLGGRVVRASVRGLWRDYERPGGAIVMDRARFIELTGDRNATTAALWLQGGVEPEAVGDVLRDALQRSGDYDVAQPGVIRQKSLALFDRTFAVTYLLEAVAVLIGLFGISASTSSQVLARRGEFGMLRHLGVTRSEIGRMLAFEGAALGAIGGAAGLGVGAVISLILIFVVNRQSFHWSMDVHVPWLGLAALSAILVVAAAGTAAFSGRRAMGDDVVRAVKEDW
ncbi:MAG TPA: FtsX-like permease family protein [Steroidobacteraceae bacterium]|nr:FtsX-like permease family protein [Steroidobacteraceae bacterium]